MGTLAFPLSSPFSSSPLPFALYFHWKGNMQTQSFTAGAAGFVPSRVLDSGILTFYIDRIPRKIIIHV